MGQPFVATGGASGEQAAIVVNISQKPAPGNSPGFTAKIDSGTLTATGTFQCAGTTTEFSGTLTAAVNTPQETVTASKAGGTATATGVVVNPIPWAVLADPRCPSGVMATYLQSESTTQTLTVTGDSGTSTTVTLQGAYP